MIGIENDQLSKIHISQDVVREISRGQYVKNNLGREIERERCRVRPSVNGRMILKCKSMKYYLIWIGFVFSGQGSRN